MEQIHVFHDPAYEHRYLRTLSATPARHFPTKDRDEAYWDLGTLVRTARLPAGLTRRQRQVLAQAVANTMSTQEGCGHDHDCCGCTSYSTRVRLFGTRRLVAYTRVTRNF